MAEETNLITYDRLIDDLVDFFDRYVCHLVFDSIRDVIAFPKIKDASCLLTDAPNQVDQKQLEELCLKIEIPEKE